MPQMEEFGETSATTTVTSASGATSRARSAALIPASLPPTAITCMTGYLPLLDDVYPGAVLVRHDGLRRLCRGQRWVQEPDEQHSGDPAAELRGDEYRGRGRRDAREAVGKHPADGDRGVGEAGGRGEPVCGPAV